MRNSPAFNSPAFFLTKEIFISPCSAVAESGLNDIDNLLCNGIGKAPRFRANQNVARQIIGWGNTVMDHFRAQGRKYE